MKFENISETAGAEINGSHYQGEVDISYWTLVELFGEPGEGDEYKIQKEWILKFEDGTIATIYDWKWGHAYNGSDGTYYTDVPVWNIGGFSSDAVARVQEVIDTLIDGEIVQPQLTQQ